MVAVDRFSLSLHHLLVAVVVFFFIEELQGDNDSGYRGSINMTNTCNLCQKWTSQSPHTHDYTPENYPNAGLGDHNFCRNPGQQEPTAWCYTIFPNRILEMCDIIRPGEYCGAYKETNNADYRGSVSITITGKTCQKWTSQIPHRHYANPANFPDKGLGDHNFCRNPDQEPTIWCYTTDPRSRFELCDIDYPEDIDSDELSTTEEILSTTINRQDNVNTAFPVTIIGSVSNADHDADRPTQRILSSQQTSIPNSSADSGSSLTTGDIPTTTFTRHENEDTALSMTPTEYVSKADTQRILTNHQTLIPSMETAKSLQQKLVDLKMALVQRFQNPNSSIMNIVDDFENQLKTMAIENDVTTKADVEGLISAGFQKANCDDNLLLHMQINDSDRPLTVNPTFVDCRNESITIMYTIFSELFFDGLPAITILGSKDVGVVVWTKVVSFSIITESDFPVDAHIRFSIPHKNVTENKVYCMFWNMPAMVWSNKGCQVTNASQTETSCVCSHTTSYSILVQVTDDTVSSSNDVTLTVLSQVLLVISTMALILGVFILFCLRRLKECVRTSIHKHLMSTLAISHVLFLIGIDRTSSKVGCTVIAVILLYLLLTVFMWMLAEAVFLYYKIFDIHGTSARYRKIYLYIFCCYGAPMLIVGVALACNFGGFGTDKACWLSQSNGHIWAFAGPALIICLVNLALIFKVAKTIYTRSKRHNTDQQKKEIAINGKAVKGALILVPLLGVTWFFGVFAFNKATMFFSYTFVIFNGSQGLAIFLVCIVFSPQVKDELKKQTWMGRFLKVNSVGSEQITTSF